MKNNWEEGKRKDRRNQIFQIFQIHNFDYNLNLSLIAKSGFSKFQVHVL